LAHARKDRNCGEPIRLAHIVIITSNMAGRINATCELTRRLRAAGHEVTLCSPMDIGERVAAQGMDYLHLGSADRSEPVTGRGAAGRFRRFVALVGRLGTIRTVDERRNAAVESLDIDRFLETMGRLDPDLYLIDIELPMQVMAVSSSGTPVAVWTTMLSLWKRPGVPPLHTDIVPGRGWRGGRLGIEWAWMRFRVWKWLRAQRLRATRVGTDQMSVLRGVADRTGFSIHREAARYEWLIPFVYRTIPTLMFNARAIEFSHEPHPVCQYVGPVLNVGRRAADADAEQLDVTRRLEQIYARRAAGKARTLIYCGFGGWHRGDDRAFFRRIVAAVGRNLEWEVVIGLGARVDPDELGALPPSVHVFGWAPQMEVLAHADLAVHHAGISSINESVVSGVPMVVYPYDYGDTPGAAARVVYHGLGLRGDRTRDSADDINRRIEQVLADPSFRRNVEAMQDRYAAYERNNAAVKAVEALLSTGGR